MEERELLDGHAKRGWFAARGLSNINVFQMPLTGVPEAGYYANADASYRD